MKVAAFASLFCAQVLCIACTYRDGPDAQRELQVMVGEPGEFADQAEMRLVARGADAIPILETGLYQGDARGRRRVIRALRKIGDDEALPILRFLSLRDKEPHVRAYAQEVLDAWPRT